MSNDNKKFTALSVSFVVVAMITLSFASVPLYDLFCKVTGYGGTTQISSPSIRETDQLIEVRFNSDVASSLEWDFQPVERNIHTRLGQSQIVYYRVKNNSDRGIVGTSSFNVTPLKAGIYFNKINCFCFEEQYLEPGEVAKLPVSFFVSPDIADDPNTKEIKTITLSYTFFNAGIKSLDKYSMNELHSYNRNKIKN